MPELEVKQEPVIIPKSVVESKAKELKEKRALPPKPGDNVPFKQLLEWMDLLTPEMVEGNRVILYVYRKEPAIIRQLADPDSDNNIDVITCESPNTLNEDYFIQMHGGGKYTIIVKDLDKPKVQKGGYFHSWLVLPINVYPPKLDYREVDWTNRVNNGFRLWAKSQRLIDENNMPVIEKKEKDTKEGSVSSDVLPMMKMMLDYVKAQDQSTQDRIKRELAGGDSLGKDIGNILLEKMKQEDPAKHIQMFATLITAMKQDKPVDNGLGALVPMFTAIMESNKNTMTIMMESNKQTMQILMKMLETKGGSSGDGEIDKLEKLLNVAQRLNTGNAPEQSTTDKILDAVTQLAPPVIGGISTLMQMNAARNNPQQPQAPQQMTHQQQVQQQVAQTQQPQQAAPTPVGIAENAKQQALIQFAPMIMANLAKDGWEFAAWIIEGIPNGIEVVASVIKDGADSLLDTMKSVPEFWSKVEPIYGEPHMRKWVNSFVNYKEEIAKAEAEEVGE